MSAVVMEVNYILKKLKQHGLRVTKPRIKLVEMLFKDTKHHHVTAELFHMFLQEKGIKISLATVYNTLHVLSDLGFLKKIKTCDYIIFDTNLSTHGHLINENTGEIQDLEISDFEEAISKITQKYQPKAKTSNYNFLITIHK
ncbi:Fur family transcriptional regulator [Rickettsiales bacterium LUAb2]